jgi:hypothetical protein
MMNQDIATLVRQEQYNDFVREAAHNPERTSTMKIKNILFAALFALSFVVILQQPTHAAGPVAKPDQAWAGKAPAAAPDQAWAG